MAWGRGVAGQITLRLGIGHQVVFTLSDARSFFWADVKNPTIGFNVKF